MTADRTVGSLWLKEGELMKKTIACCALLLWAMQAPLCAQASPEAEETKAGTDQGEEELSLQELKGGLQEAFGGMVGVMGAIMGRAFFRLAGRSEGCPGSAGRGGRRDADSECGGADQRCQRQRPVRGKAGGEKLAHFSGVQESA